MISPSVDNFLKIFNFYKLNSVKSIRQLSKSSFLYQDNYSKYFNQLNFGYSEGKEGLQYPKESSEIQSAISSREDLCVYFDNILYPGSYAFNTVDNKLFRTMLLDWASVIKTFQDSQEQCTDIYALDSESVDKAIKGFGIDFINARTVSSLYRRQTFLINMCELYKIKGSPKSIIKALKLVGLNAETISEAWVYPTRDGRKNVEIKWIPVKMEQTFNEETNSYNSTLDNDYEYWSWGSFTDKLSKIAECHWFYTKQEIINLNWSDRTYIHLPSITPYFDIKIRYDAVEQQVQIYKLQKFVNEQFRQYLSNSKLPTPINIGSYGNISVLECYLSVVYILMMFYDEIRYNALKRYLGINHILKVDYDDIVSDGHKYLQLIYKIYHKIQTTGDKYKRLYMTIVDNFVQTSTGNYDCSFNELLYWWISQRSDKVVDSQCGIKPQCITPDRVILLEDGTNIFLCWNEKYARGYYDIEMYFDDIGWTIVAENLPVSSEYMEKMITKNYLDYTLDVSNVEELKNKIRIVHYKTEETIPHIFFEKPFYFTNHRDTTFDKILSLNEKVINTPEYKNDELFNLFLDQNFGSINRINDIDLYKSLYSTYNKNVRLTDRDVQYRAFMNCLFQYPNSIHYEDKAYLINSTFYKYATQYTYNYKDFVTHDGYELSYINYDKYPENAKWNWAVSYGEDETSSYFYLNYEGKKWLRIKGGQLKTASNISIPDTVYLQNYNGEINVDYGIPVYLNGNVYIKVAQDDNYSGSYFVLDSNNEQQIYQETWNALKYEHSDEYDCDNGLDQIFKNEYNEYLIYNSDKSKFRIIQPPSDIYPNDVIPAFKTVMETKNGITEEKTYNLTDIFIKEDSKIARDIVIAKIDLSLCKSIYENIYDTINETKYDSNDINDIAESQTVIVYEDPFYTNRSYTYNYKTFLDYMYKNNYSLDVNTGYIYKKFRYYLDDNNYLYIKCINLNKVSNNDSQYKWVRVKVSRYWDKKSLKSLYSELDEFDNKKKYLKNTGDLIPELTFKHDYDVRRYLSDPVFKTDDTSSAEDKLAYMYGYIDSDINNVLLIENTGWKCKNRRSVLNSETLKENFVWYDEDKIVDGTINIDEDNYDLHYYKHKVPLINIVNFGINGDLLDYIDTLLMKSNSLDDYTNALVEFLQPLSDYCSQYLGFRTDLDLYNFTLYNTKLIQNIIKFYKPKRARHLMLNTVAEGELLNDLYDVSISDMNYNKIENENIKDDSLSNIQLLIRKEINEYIPFNDLIFIDNNYKTNVYSYRELDSEDFTTPLLEVWDKIDFFKNYSLEFNGKIYEPTFYCTDFNDYINGIYYKYSKNLYINDNYYFVRKLFLYTTIENGTLINHTEDRWLIIKRIAYIENEDFEAFDGDFISDSNIGDNPFETQDGGTLKYTRIPSGYHTYKDFVADGYFNSNGIYGIFQIYSQGNDVFKINARNIIPVCYFNSFIDSKFNGYYYESDRRINGMPVYFNQNGIMISYCDLSCVDTIYLNNNIGSYGESKKYWIITFNMEIPDFSDALYISSADLNDTIFDINDSGERTGKTIMFYDAENKIEKNESNIFFANGIYGYTLDEIIEHPEYVKEELNHLHKYDEPLVDSNNNSTRYSDIIKRRTSQNTIPERYTPYSYLDFKFGGSLSDFYKDNNGNNITHIELEIDNKTSENGIEYTHLYKSNYCSDHNGYNYGALILKDNDKLKFKIEKNIKSFHIRCKPGDNKWHLYCFIKDGDSFNVYNYYHRDNSEPIGMSSWISRDESDNNVMIIKNCAISELYMFDYDIPTWYTNVMYQYNVYRFRPEPTKKFLTYNSSNVYEPLFNTFQPRSIYGKCITGLPENVQGDRISSVMKVPDTQSGIIHDDFISYQQSLEEEIKTYKWNADSYYFPMDPKEISDIWTIKIANRVYDKEVVLKRDSEDHIIGISNIRRYKNTKNKIEHPSTHPVRYKKFFTDGVEFCVPSNYIAPGSDIPPWWNGERDEYKTGALHHNGMYISTKETLFDPYPLTGRNCMRYIDTGAKMDGYCNICGNNKLYYSSNLYDSNTTYILKPNVQVLKDDCGDYKEIIGKDDDGNHTLSNYSFDECIERYNNVEEDNHGSNDFYDCVNNINEDILNIFYDPDTFNIEEKLKLNHIYHNKIIIRCPNNELASGEYLAIEHVRHRQINDFSCCYIKKLSDELNYYLYKVTDKYEEYIWSEQSDVINLTEYYQLIPMFYEDSGYYSWELRKYKEYLVKDESYIDNINYVISKEKSHVKCPDLSEDYYLKITECHKVYNSYIYPRLSLSKKYEYDNYINQIHIDIIGQKLCEYNSNIQTDLVNKKYYELQQDVVPGSFVYNYKNIKLKHSKEIFVHNKDFISFEHYLSEIKKDIIPTENNYNYIRYKNLRQKFALVSDEDLYLYIDSKWIGPFDVIKKDPLKELNDVVCNVDYILKDEHLYIRSDLGWVEVDFELSDIPLIEENIFKPYRYNNEYYVNIPETNGKEISECWSKYSEPINIMASIWRLFDHSKDIRLNNYKKPFDINNPRPISPMEKEQKSLLDVGLSTTGRISDSVKVIHYEFQKYRIEDINMCWDNEVDDNDMLKQDNSTRFVPTPITIEKIKSNQCSCEQILN